MVMPGRRGYRDFLCSQVAAGPWNGVCRVRRGEPVIVVKKIDVHVHHFWGLGINGQTGQNKRPTRENGVFGVFLELPGR